jgi:hypothetical protein
MRPLRMAILGLAGLVALHVFMLAGHGREHDAPLGMPAVAEHSSPPAPPSLSAPMPGDEDGAGIDMTVACLAVLAGLLLLLPGRGSRLAIAGPQRPTLVCHPPRPGRAGPRTRSLAELCISLT